MGLPCYLCLKKGQDTTFVHQLATTQRGDHEEQVSNAPH
jgi:hypothetical protein